MLNPDRMAITDTIQVGGIEVACNRLMVADAPHPLVAVAIVIQTFRTRAHHIAEFAVSRHRGRAALDRGPGGREREEVDMVVMQSGQQRTAVPVDHLFVPAWRDCPLDLDHLATMAPHVDRLWQRRDDRSRIDEFDILDQHLVPLSREALPDRTAHPQPANSAAAQSLQYTQSMHRRTDLEQLATLLRTPALREELSPLFGVDFLLIELEDWDACDVTALDGLLPPPCPLVFSAARGTAPAATDHLVDLSTEADEEVQRVTVGIESNPHAAAILVQLLRHSEHASVPEALFAESLAYSCLQHGGAFESWLAQRDTRAQAPRRDDAPVLIDRDNDRVTITLNRPDKRNAYSADLRDALYDALRLVEDDTTITSALVRGAGEGFCAGGDLGEFGEARDAAAAHVTRVTASTAHLLHRLRERVGFEVHGACIGAGIELPAFSNEICAAPDSSFQLPEVSMGLIPGAGGTVSITRRIGRKRTAYLALSNERIEAQTALEWGLIDSIEARD